MRMEVLTGPERRRRWSDEEKCRIVREAQEPGVRYADVARRHDLSAAQLYQWRVAMREGRLIDPCGGSIGFLEVTDATLDVAAPGEAPVVATPIEIVLLGRARSGHGAGCATEGDMMEIGLGLYRSMLTEENFAFARMLGATNVVVHLEDYLASGSKGSVELSRGDADGWGKAVEGYWTEATFRDLIDRLDAHGLKLAAIENFAVCQWSDVLLAGPRRDAQLKELGEMILAAGRAVFRASATTFLSPASGAGAAVLSPEAARSAWASTST